MPPVLGTKDMKLLSNGTFGFQRPCKFVQDANLSYNWGNPLMHNRGCQLG